MDCSICSIVGDSVGGEVVVRMVVMLMVAVLVEVTNVGDDCDGIGDCGVTGGERSNTV